MSEIIYLNGSLVPRSQAKISVFDFGFLYGFGVFETMRAYKGKVFRMESHLERLEYAAGILGLRITTPDLKGAIGETIRVNQLKEARVRLFVSAGEGGMIPDPSICKEPTVVIMASRYKPYSKKVYDRGFKVLISSIRRNSMSPLATLKSISYLESIMAKQEARASGFDEAILLNDKGFIAEASMSNIFIVTDGILRTPGKGSGILPGITRDTVISLASQLGIKVREQEIESGELLRAEEGFLTNSLIEIMPVTGINRKPVGTGAPGILTKRLIKAYASLVIEDNRD